ncbi:DUF3180 domain-containing protein [Microlunatus sp. Y2014]|uniref:DUF3180 domain-containing protein n=1 Tax=Microlunatus sp. Y2014 TaxID=3418488 RepID=UPI003DA6F979
MRDEPASPPSPPPAPPSNPIRITGWGVVAGLAALGAALCWVMLGLFEMFEAPAPELPWTVPAFLWLVGALVAVWARFVWQAVHRDHKWVNASRGLWLLTLGKTATVGGALLGGFLLMFALSHVDRVAVPVSLARVVVAGLGVLGSVLMVIAGRALQRACRTPGADDREP